METQTPKQACLISCAKTKCKGQGKIAAIDLYIGIRFTLMLEYARKHYNDDRIYILSDEYGLVKLTDEIETYEKSLKNMTRTGRLTWGKNVICQLRKEGYSPETDEFEILAGAMYVRHITGEEKIRNFNLPLKGMKIGEQLQYLKSRL